MQKRNPEIMELIFRLGEREQAVLRSAAGRPAAKPDFATLCALYFPGITADQIQELKSYFAPPA